MTSLTCSIQNKIKMYRECKLEAEVHLTTANYLVKALYGKGKMERKINLHRIAVVKRQLNLHRDDCTTHCMFHRGMRRNVEIHNVDLMWWGTTLRRLMCGCLGCGHHHQRKLNKWINGLW